MGIHGLSKVIGDYAPSAIKENEMKTYFGKMCETYLTVSIQSGLSDC